MTRVGRIAPNRGAATRASAIRRFDSANPVRDSVAPSAPTPPRGSRQRRRSLAAAAGLGRCLARAPPHPSGANHDSKPGRLRDLRGGITGGPPVRILGPRSTHCQVAALLSPPPSHPTPPHLATRVGRVAELRLATRDAGLSRSLRSAPARAAAAAAPHAMLRRRLHIPITPSKRSELESMPLFFCSNKRKQVPRRLLAEPGSGLLRVLVRMCPFAGLVYVLAARARTQQWLARENTRIPTAANLRVNSRLS